ncbi:glycosyltransferase family 2 protein [uncultured Eudoraea sp.]|uniref:glycosyltransferase family 2 protein n=1 Tax=uncultured Eudoraea sp. TaxID=1035614 RepID=UPI002629F3B1|nr:glycosyltransferase family 2 protein [uncultured Eudoraea sp.]
MNYYIVICAHNEESYLAETLNAVLSQTMLPDKILVVNDNSTDNTEAIIDRFTKKDKRIQKVNKSSSKLHMPGAKVVDAFDAGYKHLDENYDFIVKLDADIVLPKNYFEKIATLIASDSKAGILGGFAYEQDSEGLWKLNHPMNKEHVRGAFKSYTNACYKAIGGLKNSMGWDTVDELLAQYNGFSILTDDSLKVKHLRPLGLAYNKKARYLQGEAMYRMRYGYWISLIASLKMGVKRKDPGLFSDTIRGYQMAKKKKLPYLVSKEEGKFIRRLRWKNIFAKLF